MASKKSLRTTNEVLQRSAVRLDERAQVLTEENTALKAQVAALKAPPVAPATPASPPPPPAPPSLLSQFRKLPAGSNEHRAFIEQHERALCDEIDAERRGGAA